MRRALNLEQHNFVTVKYIGSCKSFQWNEIYFAMGTRDDMNHLKNERI